jgi:hypothetical protein
MEYKQMSNIIVLVYHLSLSIGSHMDHVKWCGGKFISK